MDTSEIIQTGDDYLMGTYRRHKIALMRGEGVRLFDSERTVYLDFFSGIAVNSLGQAHPDVVKALEEQFKRLAHVSNYYYNEPNVRLAKLLCDVSFAQKVFFCNSGTEANEAAIKLARKYHHRRNDPRYEIVAFHRSFHGRTLGSLSATGQARFHAGFEPLVPGFQFATFNDIESVRKLCTEKTAAVLVECVQAEGGLYPADTGFLQSLRALTKEKGILLILDEVQTGLGRTGKMWAYQHYGIEPDLLTSAKALGAGLPMGALLATNQAASGFAPGDHASTFGGNPVVSAAAEAALNVILLKDLVNHAAKQGEYFRQALLTLWKQHPGLIEDVRGLGLMQGMQFKRPVEPFVAACERNGLLAGSAGEHVLRFLPPLIVTEKDIEQAVDKIETSIVEVLREG
jgi:acetylornithine aminotransferase/acetylornithine/N-succinyldiaminopimelate aminotransferase